LCRNTRKRRFAVDDKVSDLEPEAHGFSLILARSCEARKADVFIGQDCEKNFITAAPKKKMAHT
jgi:hypothetical protein